MPVYLKNLEPILLSGHTYLALYNRDTHTTYQKVALCVVEDEITPKYVALTVDNNEVLSVTPGDTPPGTGWSQVTFDFVNNEPELWAQDVWFTDKRSTDPDPEPEFVVGVGDIRNINGPTDVFLHKFKLRGAGVYGIVLSVSAEDSLTVYYKGGYTSNTKL